MKPVNLNQLLFHPKGDALSFYLAPRCEELDSFVLDMESQLKLQNKAELAAALEKSKGQIKKIVQRHLHQSHGFFLSHELSGYVVLDVQVDTFCNIGSSFHLRPMIEELYSNPEFMVVNVSLYDIKVYRGDFTHMEIVQHYEFNQLPKNFHDGQGARVFAPQYLGLLPYKTLLALKTTARKIQEVVQYNSLPVIVTGLDEVKDIFLRYFTQVPGVITDFHVDFYEQTCTQVSEGCRHFRGPVLDFYSAQLRERLKRLVKSKRIITEFEVIREAVEKGKVVHLILPFQERHRKEVKWDQLNELAGEVMKQGGRIQFLKTHFFPENSFVLAILKG